MYYIAKGQHIALTLLGLGLGSLYGLSGYAHENTLDITSFAINPDNLVEAKVNSVNASEINVKRANSPGVYQIAGHGVQVGPRDSNISLTNRAGYVLEYTFTYLLDQNIGGVMVPMPKVETGNLSLGFTKTITLPADAKNAFLRAKAVGRGDYVIDTGLTPFGNICFYTHGTVFSPSYTQEQATVGTSRGPACKSSQ